MFHIVLYQPKIPPNTGNIIRLCANTGAKLHLIEPLGFDMDDRRLRRAGLDYREFADVMTHVSMKAFLEEINPRRLFACSKYGKRPYHEVRFQCEDGILFGSETKGLPSEMRKSRENTDLIRIPMCPENRSLNLSNAVSIVLFEAWRQNGFRGARDQIKLEKKGYSWRRQK